MELMTLMEEKVSAKNISPTDLLELEGNLGEIHDWLASECWDDNDRLRLVEEAAGSFFGDDGALKASDYEDFRFLLQVLPEEICGLSPLELILDCVDDDSEIGPDVERYAEFLLWLIREELSLFPNDSNRVFEYALADGPESSLEYFLITADEVTAREVMLNLARTGYYMKIGDEYFEELVDLEDRDLTVAVLQIISDCAAEREAKLEGMIYEAHGIIARLCDLAGINLEELGDSDNDDEFVPEDSNPEAQDSAAVTPELESSDSQPGDGDPAGGWAVT